MATEQLFGKAQIKYGSSFASTMNLAVPLQKVTPGFWKWRKEREALDGSRVVTTIGDGVYEIGGQVRYEDDPSTLLAMLEWGMDGNTIRYVPDSDTPGTYNDCQLIEPTNLPPSAVSQEVDAPAYLEFAITIRLRREDGSAFSGVF